MNRRIHPKGICILVSIIVVMAFSSLGHADVLDPFDNAPAPEGTALIGYPGRNLADIRIGPCPPHAADFSMKA